MLHFWIFIDNFRMEQIDLFKRVLPFLIRRNIGIDKNSEKLHLHRSEEHTSELQSRFDLVCRLLLEKKKNHKKTETGQRGSEYIGIELGRLIQHSRRTAIIRNY